MDGPFVRGLSCTKVPCFLQTRSQSGGFAVLASLLTSAYIERSHAILQCPSYCSKAVVDAQWLSVQTGVLRASSRSEPRGSRGCESPASLSLPDLSLAAIKLSKVTILAPAHPHPL